MAAPRAQLVREAASRGKYAPLYRHLSAMSGSERRATFANIVATMLAHGERRLLTFNTRDFRRYGDRIDLIDMEMAS